MIILSNSLPKTASTLIASYQEDILESLKEKSGQGSLRAKYSGRYIESPSMSVLWNLARINIQSGSLIVKCHWAPCKKLDRFCRLQNVRMTMSYRDPRDMMLSMIDHGRRTREGMDPSGAFADCKTIIDLIPRTLKMMENLNVWQSKKFVHCVRYEDLLADKSKILQEMISFFGWKVETQKIDMIIHKREKTKHASWNFNKGTTERWKTELNDSEKEACKVSFKQYLINLGYELD